MEKKSDLSIFSQTNSENTTNMSISSIDKEDQTFELKKKLKILKQAIVKERQDKQMFQQKINGQQQIIDHLNKELIYKDQQYQNLKGVLNKVSQKIIHEKQNQINHDTPKIPETNSKNPKDVNPHIKQNSDIMEQINQYIENVNNDVWYIKYHELLKQQQDQCIKYQELEKQQQEQQQNNQKSINDQKLKYNIQMSDFGQRVLNLEKQLEEQKMKSQYHENEQKKINQSCMYLNQQQQEYMEKYNKKTEENDALCLKMENDLQSQQTDKAKMVQMELELVKFKAQIEGMEILLKQRQEEIESMEDKLQVYDAYKIMALSPVKCQITLRRNINNKCFINLETPNELVEIPARDIQELSKVDTNSKQFLLKYMNSKQSLIVEYIEIEDQQKLKKICKQIKRFIVQSEDDRREQQLKMQNPKAEQEKSFFSQFSAIFQN